MNSIITLETDLDLADRFLYQHSRKVSAFYIPNMQFTIKGEIEIFYGGIFDSKRYFIYNNAFSIDKSTSGYISFLRFCLLNDDNLERVYIKLTRDNIMDVLNDFINGHTVSVTFEKDEKTFNAIFTKN